MTLTELASETSRRFQERYGHAPLSLVAAPGRVNLIGEHTDYNDGFVFPMGIERYTVIAASPSALRRAQIFSADTNSEVTIDLESTVTRGQPSWSNYMRGVIAGFQKLKIAIPGFDALVMSSVPMGGGLSSSAALEVSTATLLEAASNHRLDPVQKALLCQKAEQEFAGVPCGIMDQFTSVMAKEGHLLLLDCRSRTTELVPLTNPDLSILIINSNVKHELTGGEYAERRAQCERAAQILSVASLRDASLPMLEADRARMEPLIYHRALHVISEIARTTEAAREMRAGQWSKLGQLMYASHDSLRDDFEVSCAELDLLMDLARKLGERGGVFGSRMTGGGFGGCTVSLVETRSVDAICQHIGAAYREKTGLEATMFVSRPAGGARVLK
ncbi:MAG: galactokinase [Verrucomicrobia bacterium]|nr:galactokinase [Verrucomicrobiota bacterium]